jgi:hypothetical protein
MAPGGAEAGRIMLDQIKIVDMGEKRKPGGPVVAVAPATIHPVDLIDRSRPPEQGEAGHFPWRWVLLLSLAILGTIWIAATL